jgi:hypothetical protein
LIIPNHAIKVAIKVAPKISKRKERNCALENLSLRCGATKKKLALLRNCALQRNMPNSVYITFLKDTKRHSALSRAEGNKKLTVKSLRYVPLSLYYYMFPPPM